MDDSKAIQYRPKPLPTHRLLDKGNICTPLPGVVLRICVRPGQRVRNGDLIAVVEAMKMENELRTVCDGEVASVMVRPGEAVGAGAVLAQLTIEEEL